MLFSPRRKGVEERVPTLSELISGGASIETVRSAAAAQPAPWAIAPQRAPQHARVHARLHRYTAQPARPAAGS